MKFALLCTFGSLGLVALFVAPLSTWWSLASHISVSALSFALGCLVFWVHGGNRLTAAGLYSLASGIFVGFAGIWWFVSTREVPQGIQLGTQVGFWVNLAMLPFWDFRPIAPLSPPTSARGSSTVLMYGTILSSVTLAMIFAHVSLGSGVVIQLVIGCLALVVVGMMTYPTGQRPSSRRLIAAGAAVGVFGVTAFTGYGRLNLVSLGLVGVVTLAAFRRNRSIKGLVLASIPAALAFLSYLRVQFGIRTTGHAMGGLDSVVFPLRDFGRVVYLHSVGAYDFGYGSTFWASLVFWVPRAIWEEKPDGFGRVLTAIFDPALLEVGQSYAALIQGEFYYDFGWAGVILLVPVVALTLRCFDTWWRSLGGANTPRDVLLLTAIALLLVDMPNLIWGGTQGYIARTGLRLVPVVAAYLVHRHNREVPRVDEVCRQNVTTPLTVVRASADKERSVSYSKLGR